MATAPYSEGVVNWPVDIGSETVAPIHWRMAGSPGEDAGLLVWVGGHGVKVQDLAVAAMRLRESTGGMTVIGVELPIKDVICKANDVADGLKYLVLEGVHRVVQGVDPDRDPFIGGESRGGNVAIEAGSSGPVRGVVALSTMGLASDALGKTPIARAKEAGWRLGRTAKDYGFGTVLRDPAMRRTVFGGIWEVVDMTVHGKLGKACDFGFSDQRKQVVLAHVKAHKERADRDRGVGGFDVSLHFPEDDGCFELGPNMEALRSIGCEGLAVVVKGRHTCVGSVTAAEQLQSVGEWLAGVHANQVALADRSAAA